MIIDLSPYRLSKEFITDLVFQQRLKELAMMYIFADRGFYETWFDHNIPEDIYWDNTLTPLEKVMKYGFPYFSMTEDPTGEWYKTEAGAKYLPSVITDNRHREQMITAAKDKYSPYWYSLKTTCHMSVVLANMMAQHLFPDETWYSIHTGGHAFVANRPADQINSLEDFRSTRIVDLLLSQIDPGPDLNREQMLLDLGRDFSEWMTLPSNDEAWCRLSAS